jgi:hypothetical protein
MPSQSNKTRSKNKRDSNKEGKSQTLPIFRWHEPIIEDPKCCTKKKKTIRNYKLSAKKQDTKLTYRNQ